MRQIFDGTETWPAIKAPITSPGNSLLYRQVVTITPRSFPWMLPRTVTLIGNTVYCYLFLTRNHLRADNADGYYAPSILSFRVLRTMECQKFLLSYILTRRAQRSGELHSSRNFNQLGNSARSSEGLNFSEF